MIAKRSLLRSKALNAVVILISSIMLSLSALALSDATSRLRTGIFVPLAALVVVIMAVIKQEVVLLYLLAVIWVMAITTGGFSAIPLTGGLTAWELLLYVGVAVAMALGRISLLRRSADNQVAEGRGGLEGVWIGLLLVLFGSLAVLGKTNSEGYGNFRYAAINPLLVFILATSLIKRSEQLVRFSIALCIGSLAVLVMQVIPGFDMSTGRLQLINRLNVFGDQYGVQANRLGLWINSCMPLILCYVVGAKKRVLRWGSLLLYLALAVVLFLTVSRGCQIAALVSSVLVLLVMSRVGYRRRAWAIIGLLAAIMLVVLVFNRSWSVLNPSFLRTGDLESRLELWRLSIGLVTANPLGIGYGALVPITGMWEHNMFILVMNGGGLIGLLGLVVFFISYISACIRAMRRSEGILRLLCIAALGSAVSLILTGMSMEILYPTYPEAALLMLALGFCAVKLAYRIPAAGVQSSIVISPKVYNG